MPTLRRSHFLAGAGCGTEKGGVALVSAEAWPAHRLPEVWGLRGLDDAEFTVAFLAHGLLPGLDRLAPLRHQARRHPYQLVGRTLRVCAVRCFVLACRKSFEVEA